MESTDNVGRFIYLGECHLKDTLVNAASLSKFLLKDQARKSLLVNFICDDHSPAERQLSGHVATYFKEVSDVGIPFQLQVAKFLISPLPLRRPVNKPTNKYL